MLQLTNNSMRDILKDELHKIYDSFLWAVITFKEIAHLVYGNMDIYVFTVLISPLP